MLFVAREQDESDSEEEDDDDQCDATAKWIKYNNKFQAAKSDCSKVSNKKKDYFFHFLWIQIIFVLVF